MRILKRVFFVILFLYVVYAVATYGWVLRITCNRTSTNEINCARQWTLLMLIPLGETRDFDWHDFKRICYVGGCNYYIDQLSDGSQFSLAGTSAEPVDLFLKFGGNSLIYHLGEWSTYITWIEFTTYPVVALVSLALLLRILRNMVKRLFGTRIVTNVR